MSSVSSASVNTAWLQTQMQMKAYASGTHKSQQAEQAFSKIDTGQQGFFDLAGLTTAVDKAVASNQNTKHLSFSASDIETAFKKIDSDGDGKVTQQEFTSTMSQLKGRGGHHHHDGDSNIAATDGSVAGMQGMPPPPPSNAQSSSGADEGFTSDELKAQLNAIGESDAKRSTLINQVLNNFSAADTQTASMSDTSAEQLQQKLMRQLMRMMQAYGTGEAGNTASTTAQLSVTA